MQNEMEWSLNSLQAFSRGEFQLLSEITKTRLKTPGKKFTGGF
jgi:hypothetical protein